MKYDPGYYRLEGHTPVRCKDVEEWARCFDLKTRHVGDTRIGGLRISTVFLGLDHSSFLEDGPPILFETMVFGAPIPTTIFGTAWHIAPDLWQQQCSTWEEAEAMHHAACDRVLAQMLSIESLLPAAVVVSPVATKSGRPEDG